MIRTKGEPGTGNVAEAVNHIKKINKELREVKSAYQDNDYQELVKLSREHKVSIELVKEVGKQAGSQL